MSRDYWQQQSSTPLFADILWSRPETKQDSGKLLIIGGNSFGLAAPARAYATAQQSGIGVAKVLLPEALRKTVGGHLADTDFAPNNLSGSFSRLALDQMLVHVQWADAVLLAGELGRNSETAVTLEEYTKKFNGPLCVTRDAVDYFLQTPSVLINRPLTLVVASFEQLQKLAMHAKYPEPLLFSMDNALLAEWLHQFSLVHVWLCYTTQWPAICCISGAGSLTKNYY